MLEKPTIVLVHGMFMTAASWRDWVSHFEARGYRCVAPDWPGRSGQPASLRANPDPVLSTLRLPDVVAHVRGVLSSLSSPPILIGHSMGGLVVQLLMQQGLGERAVAIASAPPFGVRSFALSHLRSNAAVLVPSKAPIMPSFGWFRYAFAHRMPEAEARALYERDVVPESRLVGKGPLGAEAKLDFAKLTAPALFLAGGDDHIIPPSLVEKTAARYAAHGANVSFESLPGHTHSLCSDSGAPEVIARVEAWLNAPASTNAKAS